MNFKTTKPHVSFKKVILSALLITTFSHVSLAQEESEESKGKDKKNDLSSKFFMALSTSTYTDLIVTPLKFYYGATGNTDQQGNPTFAEIPYQTQQLNIVSIGMEPRLNLKEFDDNSSISISAPVSFGIGNSFSAAGEDLIVRGINGFGSIQVPLLFKLNLGNGSTYTTEKDYGFSAGAGFELNKVGLINLTELSRKYNKAFVLPCLSAGFTFMRGDTPMEINFKYAFGKVRTQEYDPQGGILKDNNGIPYIRNTRGQSLKLSFVYLINY